MLVAVTIPPSIPILAERLEKRLRRLDLVAWLAPSSYVLLASEIFEGDGRATGDCDLADVTVHVAFASSDHGVTPEDLIRSLVAENVYETPARRR